MKRFIVCLFILVSLPFVVVGFIAAWVVQMVKLGVWMQQDSWKWMLKP